jgi:membrane protein implicated in regulation of membrane protease activity
MLAAIIILLVLALLLIAAELVVVGGVLGAMGVLLIFVAAGLSFYFYSMEAALALLLVSFTLAGLIVVFGFRFLRNSRTGKHLFLADATSAGEGFESMDDSLDAYRGKRGSPSPNCIPRDWRKSKASE